MKKILQQQWVKTVLAAWERMRVTNGNLYAGAITYFSFLAIFPMLLLAASVLGFVLSSHPDLLQSLLEKVTANAPGSLGDTLKSTIEDAIKLRTAVGIVGLVGFLFTGLGWIGNLRASIDAVWKRQPPKENFVKQKITNLGILGSLGLGLIASLGVTALWSAASSEILDALGLGSVPGMSVVFAVLGIAVTLVGDAVLFYLVLVRMPRVSIPRRVGLQGSLMASVGFEILKYVGTFTITHTINSPTAGPFAVPIALLVWIQLVVRMMLFCAAWMAERVVGDPVPPPKFESEASPAVAVAGEPALSPRAVGAGLVGAGAVAGAAVAAYTIHRNRAEDG